MVREKDVIKTHALPLAWKPETNLQNILHNRNDQNWLENVVANAAPFSDWWTKARIVQLAFPPLTPDAKQHRTVGLTTYQALTSEQDIVSVLKSCCDLERYPEFTRRLNVSYVSSVLKAWRSYQFTQAISRNFEVYEYIGHPFGNVYLVTSTAPVSLGVRRKLPPSDRFRPLFNVDELAQKIKRSNISRITLRTHGYSNAAEEFYKTFEQEAIALKTSNPTTHTRTLADDHLYIGYHWPSEKPILSSGLWMDYRKPMGIVFKFLFVLCGLAGLIGGALYWFLRTLGVPVLLWIGQQIPSIGRLMQQTNFEATANLAVQWYWVIPTVFILWLLSFFLQRVVVYQRDRYRAVHYGAPDLAEFFWRLDAAINRFNQTGSVLALTRLNESNIPCPDEDRLLVNLVGHSMGGLLLVNLLRIMSDWGRDDKASLTLSPDSQLSPEQDNADCIGHCLKLDKLILASPDIPLEFLREGRNNYVRSAMRRCRRIYLFSSDRDTVLRYLSTIGNWFTEPSIQMAGLRLGNVYLKPVFKADYGVPYRPYVRIMFHSQAAVQPTSSYELFCKFNYLDCSQMRGYLDEGGVNAVPLSLNWLTALPIDLLNTFIYLFSAITPWNTLDVHGGYFQPKTISFKVFRFLLMEDSMADGEIKRKLESLVAGTPVKFLPSQPWIMPEP